MSSSKINKAPLRIPLYASPLVQFLKSRILSCHLSIPPDIKKHCPKIKLINVIDLAGRNKSLARSLSRHPIVMVMRMEISIRGLAIEGSDAYKCGDAIFIRAQNNFWRSFRQASHEVEHIVPATLGRRVVRYNLPPPFNLMVLYRSKCCADGDWPGLGLNARVE